MRQYLIDHATQNVWCNPDQDNQLIFAARKITVPNGEMNRFRLMKRQVSLPSMGKRYHVYKVGQIQPRALGLLALPHHWSPEKWIKFSDAMELNKVIVSIYTSEGVSIPRHNAYYMFSDDRALIFALEIDPKIPVDYELDQIYVRLYSNAYFQSLRSDQSEDYLRCRGGVAADMQSILEYQTQVTAYRQRSGNTSCYVNGFAVPDISPLTASLGDRVEYVYDSSVKNVITYTVNSLDTFNSTLDSKYKYLLRSSSGDGDTIDYQDDIDVYVLDKKINGSYRGLYYHRNNEDSHRMVTHRDYSVVVDYFDYIAEALIDKTEQPGLDVRGLKLQVVIRNSGYHRALVFDNSRIFELYRLSQTAISQAMTGLNSTLEIWKASSLENNAYTELMRSRLPAVNIEQVQKAYGYNGIAKLVGDTPSKTTLVSSRQTAYLPYALQNNATAYEYDEQGLMLGWHLHAIGSDYQATDLRCRMVEVLGGRGTQTSKLVFGVDNLPLPRYHNYRVYMCFYDTGVIDNEWMDITGTDKYDVINHTLIWNNLHYDHFLMIRSDETFLAYDMEIERVNGNLFFTLSEMQDRVQGDGLLPYELPVPMGDLDIFLNGKSLIQGLDYILKFPTVYILNHTHLQIPVDGPQRLHVRYSGFCDVNMTANIAPDYGFIEHGYLSNNNRYDIRTDKVLRITVDGDFKHRDSLLFSEDHDGISLIDPHNGKPYQIKDIIISLKELSGETTYTLREKSRQIDRQVSDYMTIKKPQTDRGDVNAIVSRYTLVSPFFCRLIHDLDSGFITDLDLSRVLSDTDVIQMCRPYEYLLDFDPINEINKFDFRYVMVRPHAQTSVVDLNIYQYRFLMKVIKLFGRDLISPNNYITYST